MQGVHTWNLMGSAGGIGIVLWNGAGRVQQCYLDYAPLVIRRTQAAASKATISQLAMVQGNLFLGTANIVLVAAVSESALSGLVCTGNIFSTFNAANATVILDESQGRFTSVLDVTIDQNEAGTAVLAAGKLSTRATMTASFSQGSSTVTINFSSALIFGVLPSHFDIFDIL